MHVEVKRQLAIINRYDKYFGPINYIIEWKEFSHLITIFESSIFIILYFVCMDRQSTHNKYVKKSKYLRSNEHLLEEIHSYIFLKREERKICS